MVRSRHGLHDQHRCAQFQREHIGSEQVLANLRKRVPTLDDFRVVAAGFLMQDAARRGTHLFDSCRAISQVSCSCYHGAIALFSGM